METIQELTIFLEEAIKEGIRDNLADRGTAWSLMRIDDAFEEGAINLGEFIDSDLADYGFTVLRASLALNEKNGDKSLISKSFLAAGRAFESLVTNADSGLPEIGFYRVVCAASYHLAGYSAIAYSVLNVRTGHSNNNTIAERALIALMLRDLQELKVLASLFLNTPTNQDDEIARALESEEIDMDTAVERILNLTVCRSLTNFDFALQTGDASLFHHANELLVKAIDLAANGGAVYAWWICRLSKNIISDLWGSSLHQNLPTSPPVDGEKLYAGLRKKFILSLYQRKASEVELWPSQIEAALRSTDLKDDLVVALPTSAGKTRIAEIAALMTLSVEKRIVIVTPLRALSAQTERSFRKTFGALGFTVSSLYGASGVSQFDSDALKDRHIVITTPEKLDFALRNDTSIIDDVGLIILDEGHLIGPSEREIRYELLVQRLLRRRDAKNRRIVCLSAILPDGDNINDFTSWLRKDVPGTAVKKAWRPTRQRFGTLTWTHSKGHLNFDYKSEIPFINNFVSSVPGLKPHKGSRPMDLNGKTLFAAWKFAEQGKRTLIFVTQANWVEKFGSNAVDFVSRGYLPTLLEDKHAIARALEIGKEWLGSSHPAVKALKIGVAVHHGGLPNPFLRELEVLLSTGVIKVTVASPTLSQGLNINAAVLLVPYLVRSGQVIKGEEFANVAGRAGRAFVDVEGFVVHVIENQVQTRKVSWKNLIDSARERNLSSGLFEVVNRVLIKLAERGIFNKEDAFEYLSGSIEAWSLPANTIELAEDDLSNEAMLEKLDSTVLGLIEALEAESKDLPELLENALKGSLWERQINRSSKSQKEIHQELLLARAKLIWSETSPTIRKGHFAMGVGFNTGLVLDNLAPELDTLLGQADACTLFEDVDQLITSVTKLAEILLNIRPFKPVKNPAPENWKEILNLWIRGVPIDVIGADYMPFIEEAFCYRLVWAFEALRMRRVALGDNPTIQPGGASSILENGVPRLMMALLIRAGLPSRKVAMRVIDSEKPSFFDSQGMFLWLQHMLRNNNIDFILGTESDLSEIWEKFLMDIFQNNNKKQELFTYRQNLDTGLDVQIEEGIYRLEIDDQNIVWICTVDFVRLARFKQKVLRIETGIYSVRIGKRTPEIEHFGHKKLKWVKP